MLGQHVQVGSTVSVGQIHVEPWVSVMKRRTGEPMRIVERVQLMGAAVVICLASSASSITSTA